MEIAEQKNHIFIACPICKEGIPDMIFLRSKISPIVQLKCECIPEEKTYALIDLLKEFHIKAPKEILSKCKTHDKEYVSYCKQCKISICTDCKNDHQTHELEEITPIDIALLEQILSSSVESLKAFEDIKVQFMIKVNNPILALEESVIKEWERKFNAIFNVNLAFNQAFKAFIEQLYYTAKEMKGQLNYSLMKITQRMIINIKKVDMSSTNVTRCFDATKSYLEKNFIIVLSNEFIKKEYPEIVALATKNQCFEILLEHSSNVKGLVQLNNKTLVSASDDASIKFWDISTSESFKSVNEHSRGITALIQLQDGSLATSSIDKTIKIWNSTDLKCIGTLTGHTKMIFCLTQVNEETLASGSLDKTIKLWSLKTCLCTTTIKGHEDSIYSLCSLNNEIFASGSMDCTIKIWQNKELDPKSTLSGHTDVIACLLKLKDETLVSGSFDCTIKVWNVKESTCAKTLSGHDHFVLCLCQLRNGMLISGSGDNNIKIWNLETSECTVTLIGHTDPVNSLLEVDDNVMASGSQDATIKLWKL